MTLFVSLMLWPEAETGIYLYMLVELHTVLIYKCRDAISKRGEICHRLLCTFLYTPYNVPYPYPILTHSVMLVVSYPI